MLRKHQIDGANWLANAPRGSYLADAPRVGKTRTALAALDLLQVKSPLVVTPAMVRTHWQRESKEMEGGWLNLSVKSYDEIRTGGADLMRHLINDQKVDALILDEAHYLKHGTSLRTKQLFGRMGYVGLVPHVIPLSGTPFSKTPADLWTWLFALHPDVLRAAGFTNREKFEQHFAQMRYMGIINGRPRYKAMHVKNEEELKALLAPIMLRRTLADLGRDVPALDWQVVTLGGDTPWFPYQDSASSLAVQAIRAGNLEHVRSDPQIARMRRRIGELKVPLVVEMLKEQLPDGKPLVVLAYHRNVLDALYEGLFSAGFGVRVPITGDTPQSVRDQIVDQFQRREKQVFLAQENVASVGIRLDAADTIVLVEPDWTADVNTQAAMRIVDADRPERKCVVQMIALADTLDEAIVRQNKREVEMQEKVL